MINRQRRAVAQLLLRLKPVNRLLRAAAARASRHSPAPARLDGLGLSFDELEHLFGDVERLSPCVPDERVRPDHEEIQLEAALRAGSDEPLPLDELAHQLRLTDFEIEALILCAAPEVDSRYERIYGYILDDLGRGAPCVELLCSLSASDAAERHARRAFFDPQSRLVRVGLLRRGADNGSEWRREVRLTGRALAFLLGDGGPIEGFYDPDDVSIAAGDAVRPWGIDESTFENVVRGLAGSEPVAVSVYGPRESSQAELPGTLAARAGRPLRRFSRDMDTAALADAADVARRLDAILWLATDSYDADPATEQRLRSFLDRLDASGPHLILTGGRPIRSLALMASRPWFELAARAPSLDEVEALWASEVPELDGATHADIARRYRLSPTEVRAAANVFRSAGVSRNPGMALERACRTVARRQTERFATVITPTRGPDDLVLPAAIHESVLNVARFALAWPQVAERWGLARLHSGGRGVRALFTGPSGTGKTRAAEVIAGTLGQELHRIDLASLVSKWVGETEKNLDSAFREAEQSQAVLFFDEAEALFSKRGEVKHGMDRYANLEVSYLLQRLEEYAGVVILASNLKDNLDEAFSRRFHIVVDFPRPAEAERRRLWAMAFPSQVPREGLDEPSLAKLDMTGATIMNAARTAALLAATDGQVVRPEHVIEGISREFRRESRILLPGEIAGLRPRTVG